LERMAVLKRLEAQLAAVKARDAAEALDIQHAMAPPEARLHERTYAEMSAIEEIAAVLTISSPAAAALLTQARHLTSLPLAMDALAAGTISWQHARIIADESEGLGPAGATALTGHFFDPNAPHPARGAAPGELSPSRFRAKVRAWRERHHPQTLEKRHAKSAADRRMEYTPDRDGMAWLSLYLPADTANAIWNRTTALARGLQHPREPRTITQLRPDIAASLLLGAATALRPDQDTSRGQNTTGEGNRDDVLALGQVPAPKADVLVTVPVFALLGLTDEPAHLDGYGPIPTSMARKLLTHGAGSFYRVLVDPRDGAPLEIGRTNYRVTKVMKKALQLRDGKCTFPGCNNRSLDNDTDHLQAWQHGGTTGISNLAQLCPKHHRLKHNSGWTPTPATKTQPPGWTSPTGRHYKPEQPDREPPHWPPGLPPGATETPGHLPGPTETPGRFDAEPSWIFAEDPPPEEPIDDNLENPADFPPDDPVWDDFYAAPPKLAKDPFPDWHLWLSESGR
ncbi:MAG: DUF222 domain-containing protein, partial [Arthrobacter sp.]